MLRSIFLLLLFAGISGRSLYAEAPSALALLKNPGTFAIMRHALAPGTGDPQNFDLADCTTQRNLSDAGREQAITIGNLFRKSGIKEAEVFSSQWCRCMETAGLLDLGPVTELPALNSFFQRPGVREKQMTALKRWLENREMDTPTLLVTHQVVITALTGIFPASGEIIILQKTPDGKYEVAAQIKNAPKFIKSSCPPIILSFISLPKQIILPKNHPAPLSLSRKSSCPQE